MSFLRPLCKGTVTSLANHPSTTLFAEKTIMNQHCQGRHGEPDTIRKTHVGILSSKGGRLIAYSYQEFWGNFFLCELFSDDLDRMFKNPEFWDNSRYLEILAEVNTNKRAFFVKIPEALKTRILEADRINSRELKFTIGDTTYRIQTIEQLAEFLSSEFPEMELFISDNIGGKDGLLCCLDDGNSMEFRYNSDTTSERPFKALVASNSNGNPFIGILNLFGMKAVQTVNTENQKGILLFPFNGIKYCICSIYELIQFVRECFPDITLDMVKESECIADGAMFWKDGEVLGFWKDNVEGAVFECYYPPFGNAKPFTEFLNVIGMKAVKK